MRWYVARWRRPRPAAAGLVVAALLLGLAAAVLPDLGARGAGAGPAAGAAARPPAEPGGTAAASGVSLLPGSGPAPKAPATAAAAARASGHRVEVTDRTTPSQRVFANPDGTYTLEQSVVPVRVRRGGRWVPVDLTLRAGAGGMVAPVATAVPVLFSGGGSAPLLRLGDPGRRLTLRWPDPLPRPVLSGATATYGGVLPGVDLRLTATRTGFRKVLVVHTRQAAADPALRELRFGVRADGVRLRLARGGRIDVVDRRGGAVFSAGTPQLWDSPTAPVGARPDGGPASQVGTDPAASPVRAPHRAAGRVTLAGRQLLVHPDQGLLTDPRTNYPVYLDPDFGAPRTGWGNVYSGHSKDHYWGGDGDGFAKAGDCDWPGCNGIGVSRSYFQYDINPLRGKHVLSAEFNILENHTPSCTATPVGLYYTSWIDPNLSWNAQPGVIWPQNGGSYAYGRAGCPAAFIGWDATRSVVDAVNAGSATLTFGLIAGNEGDPLGWKKFDPNTAGVVVHYNSVPDVPSGLSGENLPCKVQAEGEPYLFTPRPTLRATITDPDGGQSVVAQYEWYVRFGALQGSASTAPQPAGTPTSVRIPAGTFTDGSKIAWRVRGYDGVDSGPWSQWCDLTVDQQPPDRPPTVTSASYPPTGIHGGIGWTGTFQLQPNGVGDVAGYRYGLIDPPSTFVPAAPDGTATVAVTPVEDGPNRLWVQSVDRAGNPYPNAVPYSFQVGPPTPAAGRWPLDGAGADTAAPDISGNHHDGTVAPIGTGAGWGAGRVDAAIRLDGRTGSVTTTGSTVRTDGTFTVAAWVRLDNADSGFHTAVSQDGNRASGFYLQYIGAAHTWAISVPPADVDSFEPDRVLATAPAAQGVWTHLTASFDAGSGRLSLWVNGVEQGAGTPVSHQSRWNAAGAVQIGRAKYAGNPVDFWPGAIDDVQVYPRLLSPAEIHDLATGPANEDGFWPLDEGTGTMAGDQSGGYRPGTLSGGASWVPGAVGTGAVQLDGASGAVQAAGPAVRTDGAFTLSAMVRAGALGDADRTVVSQRDPAGRGGFALQYQGASHRWALSLTQSGAAGAATVRATASAPPQAGEWTHLAGVYDPAGRELRVYVNGQSAGSAAVEWAPANAAGPLQIGREAAGAGWAAYWLGTVDDVHVYTGVRTGDAIRDEFLHPVVTPVNVYSGQVSRWYNLETGEHFTTASGPPPAGYHFELALGQLAPAGVPDTRPLYLCQLGTDEFTSAQVDCEGQRPLGLLGSVYTRPPAGAPAIPMYRCTTSYAPNDHFDTFAPDCEGHHVDGLLGYIRPYVKLIRYVQVGSPWEHWATRAGVPGSYRPEGSLGLIYLLDGPYHPLMVCRDGADTFDSDQADCEGKQVVHWIGNIWPDPPADLPSRRLLRCRVTAGGELFESVTPDCEGQTVDRPLGYLVAGL
jgi:Concanavalin A-like lectin/glucanases superfamily